MGSPVQVISRHRENCVCCLLLDAHNNLWDFCGGIIGPSRWVAILCATLALGRCSRRKTARTESAASRGRQKTQSWKAVSAIYLDNVTWHGDCECNLIVNYSSRARKRERDEKIEMPDRLLPEKTKTTSSAQVKRTINQSRRAPCERVKMIEAQLGRNWEHLKNENNHRHEQQLWAWVVEIIGNFFYSRIWTVFNLSNIFFAANFPTAAATHERASWADEKGRERMKRGSEINCMRLIENRSWIKRINFACFNAKKLNSVAEFNGN